MKKILQNTRSNPSGCQVWQDRIPSLTAMSPDDPERRAWERHALQCPACAAVSEANAGLELTLKSLPDPGPAYLSVGVMKRLRSQRATRSFRIPDLGWTLAGGLAGVVAGFLLARGALMSQIAVYDPVDDCDLVFARLEADAAASVWDYDAGATQESDQ